MMGRQRKVDEAKSAKMRAMRKYASPAQIANRFNVSVATVNKYAPKGAA